MLLSFPTAGGLAKQVPAWPERRVCRSVSNAHDIALTPTRQREPREVAHALRARPDPSRRPRSLYLHVPFCFHKCHYCDFYSIVDSRDRQAAFVDRLDREIQAIGALADQPPLRTIFVGGGTPTLLRPDLWERLAASLRTNLNLSNPDLEFTVECNPETATPELFDVLQGAGVNRLSFGAQSFNTAHLKTLERWHDPDSVPRALELAHAAGIRRVSLDLIYGIPGQTLDEALDDIERALALGVTHLSAYALTYEPGTAMTARRDRGEFAEPDEDLEADIYDAAVARLAEAGLGRYEVSNFARADHECRHNLAYWRQEAWLAAGPSASGHLHEPDGGSHRWKNVPRLDSYLRDDFEGLAPVIDYEAPDALRLVAERIMSGIRLAEGVDRIAILDAADRAEPGAAARLQAAEREPRERGWLLERDDRWVLSDAGFLFADGVARRFLGVLRKVGPG